MTNVSLLATSKTRNLKSHFIPPLLLRMDFAHLHKTLRRKIQMPPSPSQRVRPRHLFHGCRVYVVDHLSGCRPDQAAEVAVKTGSLCLHARCQTIRRISDRLSVNRSSSSMASKDPATCNSITTNIITRDKHPCYCSLVCDRKAFHRSLPLWG